MADKGLSLIDAGELFRVSQGTRPRALLEYQTDPLRFFTDILGVPRSTVVWSENTNYHGHVWDGTPDPLVAMLDGLVAWDDVGVESGTGTGKSFTAACAILWFLAVWDGARVFTFAPKEDQLRLYIWSEMTKLWPRFAVHFPNAELTDLRIRMMAGSDEWGAWGYAVGVRADEQVATKAAGMHAAHMLLVYEETPGIPLPVMAAGENTCTAPHNIRLALGNPDHQQDALHTFCVSPGVRHVRVSALDHPNVVTGDENTVPGAVSRKSVVRRRQKYGLGARLYESRVRGISPAEAAEALIRLSWCESAATRHGLAAYRDGPRGMGVDVANSESGDLGAIAYGIGACLDRVEAFPCPDNLALGDRVADEAERDGIDQKFVGIDSVGVGAGTVNQTKRRSLYAQALNGGAKPEPSVDEEAPKPGERRVLNEEKFYNLRAQMWWQARVDLERGLIALPNDPELFQDLITPQWETKNGKILVESKEDIRERLGRSPNKGDAAVYWNWVRRRRPIKTVDEPWSAGSPEALKAEVEQKYTHRGREQRKKLRIKGITDPNFGRY